MAWIIGIDEAGYGPNLGPLVMTAVACRVPDRRADADLWHLLRPAVRRHKDGKDTRLSVDDSKVVYTARGLAGLERSVLGALWRPRRSRRGAPLASLVEWACPDDRAELGCEAWYQGAQGVPVHAVADELAELAERFDEACDGSGVGEWHVRSTVLCPPRFNALLDNGAKKGVVLAHAMTCLLRWKCEALEGEDALCFFIDKHGGRNAYAALVGHALPGGAVLTRQEGMARSAYEVHGLGREVRLTFEPRADAAYFCAALASMASKYLRELLMLEFNRFWQERVPGLKPTAGYPGDAERFLRAIRPAAAKLGIPEAALWRRK
jgi:hypothetical protein